MTSAGRLGDPAFSASAERILLQAEQRIRLLDRLTPLNLVDERRRLLQELEAGRRAEPRFEYEVPNGLAELRRELELLIESLRGGGALADLYAERAEELLLEVRIVAAAGTPELRRLATQRYPSQPSEALDALLAKFRALSPEAPSELIPTSDETDPRSLLSVLRARIGELRAPVRIELRAQLHSVAAAGDGFVAIRADARLTARAAERIAAHELFAHVLPRLAAREEALGVYRVGARGANEDEEGRALCLEERSALWDKDRQRELLRRHELALAVRAGADLNELIETAVAGGLARSGALDLSLRALRGGGLAREAVYLPAYLSISRAFARDPACERYFERGRASLASLSKLRELDLSR